MKSQPYNIRYNNIYKDILQTTDSITFEQFVELHSRKLIDTRKTHFVISENDDFGHFEVEKKIPSYRYDIFFEPNYAK